MMSERKSLHLSDNNKKARNMDLRAYVLKTLRCYEIEVFTCKSGCMEVKQQPFVY